MADRFASLTIAGSKKFRSITRKVYTDQYISLSGSNSVIGKSFVIYDEFGPKARGNRFACLM